jgi:hypothetical protein
MQRVMLCALLALAVAACSERRSSPTSPSFELVDPTERIDADKVNAHVYGSFALDFTTQGGSTVITSGPANFPGHPPAGPGTCVDGTWYNSQGKRTAGSLDKPHPHCVSTGDGTSITVVLEPISSDWGNRGQSSNEFLRLAADLADGSVRRVGGGSATQTKGDGIIVGYAIDASTLAGTPKRVGTLTIDLNQLDDDNVNLFDSDCSVDEAARCLPRIIGATYDPLPAPDGVGIHTESVQGFFWWKDADAPYNY